MPLVTLQLLLSCIREYSIVYACIFQVANVGGSLHFTEFIA